MVPFVVCLIASLIGISIAFHSGGRNYATIARIKSRAAPSTRQWPRTMVLSLVRNDQMPGIDIQSLLPPNESRADLISKAEAALASGIAENVVVALENLSKVPYNIFETGKLDVFSYLTPEIMNSMTPNQAVRLTYLLEFYRSRCSEPRHYEIMKQIFSIVFGPHQSYPMAMVKKLLCRIAFTKARIGDMDPVPLRNFYDNLKLYIDNMFTKMMCSVLFYFEMFGLEPGTMPLDVQHVFLDTIIKQTLSYNETTGSEVLMHLGNLKFNITSTAAHKNGIHSLGERMIRKCGPPRRGRKDPLHLHYRNGDCLTALKGLTYLGVTYETATPDLKETLRRLITRFPYYKNTMGSFVYWLGRLGLYWELFKVADQVKILSEVKEALKETTALNVARMTFGLGKIVQAEKRVSSEVKETVIEGLSRILKQLEGRQILMVIEGLADMRCPLSVQSEKFQLDFQLVLETALRSNSEEYIAELAALLDKWQVDRSQLLPEIQRRLEIRGIEVGTV